MSGHLQVIENRGPRLRLTLAVLLLLGRAPCQSALSNLGITNSTGDRPFDCHYASSESGSGDR